MCWVYLFKTEKLNTICFIYKNTYTLLYYSNRVSCFRGKRTFIINNMRNILWLVRKVPMDIYIIFSREDVGVHLSRTHSIFPWYVSFFTLSAKIIKPDTLWYVKYNVINVMDIGRGFEDNRLACDFCWDNLVCWHRKAYMLCECSLL